MWSPTPKIERWLLKPAVFLACLTPFLLLVIGLVTSNLGFNPVEHLTHETGQWGLRFLLVTLAITPLKTLTSLNWLMRFRRMLGLYAFFYALMHFLIYFVWDQSLEIGRVFDDVFDRPYITLGFASLCLMVPLAITSPLWARRKLRQRWNQLHKLMYPLTLLAVLHFVWLVRADYREVSVYAAIFALLMILRAPPIKNALIQVFKPKPASAQK